MSAAPAPLVLGPLLDALRGVKWPTRELVRAGLPGTHRANQRGTTGEFTEYRAYRQGDDPRRIDWRLLARSDRAYVRITDERAWRPTWLLVDASASMQFPVVRAAAPDRSGSGADDGAVLDKWTMTRALTAGLAAVAHATGDPVGLLVAMRPEPRRLPPRTRRGTVQAIAKALDGVAPGDTAMLAPLLSRVPVGVRTVLVTDALGDTDALLSSIARACAAGSEVWLLHVVHPLELTPPRGAWLAVDPEARDGALAMQRPLTTDSQASYRAAFDAWRAEVARRCVAAGGRYHEVRCDELPARAVRRIAAAAMAGVSA
jgi:uncharacterized protein (DUF58 family)